MPESLRRVLSHPCPDSLWALRADLLERGFSPEDPAITAIGDLFGFLDRFATATSARELNDLASKLDMSAMGGVVLEQVLERPEPGDLAMRILTGSLSEGLMVLASRQYVHAQDEELSALFRSISWRLFERLWQWTAETNPDLEPTRRRQLIDDLTAPVRDASMPHGVRAAVCARILLVLLVSHLQKPTESGAG